MRPRTEREWLAAFHLYLFQAAVFQGWGPRMSRLLFLCSVAFGFVMVSSAPAPAQFQEPTKDELQMTADPKVPGAKAVYLYYEDVQDDGSSSSRTYYERVKVLTEKGKELATVRYTHDPKTKFEVWGRTIHKDGTVIPLTDKPSDLVEFKTKGMQLNSVVFTLPSVEVGSILEYRVKFKYDTYGPDPTWMIQQGVFVHKAHFSFKSALPVNHIDRLGNGLKVVDDKHGTCTLDATDVAPLPDEEWLPPMNTLKWKVDFFYTTFKSTKEFWDYAGKTWAEVVNEYTRPTSELKRAVADMVVPADSETVKAQKIYAAVMKLENTDFTREKTKQERKKEKIKDIHNAQDVWRNQSGSGDEIALLYVALARTAGLNVAPMKVVDRSRALFDEGLLNSGQLDDYIAVAKLDGQEVYLDPGQKMCPFGLLHWKHTLAKGFRLDDKNATIDRTPSPTYKTANLVRVADIAIDPAGSVTGDIRYVLQGQEAMRWRQIALENGEDEVKKKFNKWLQENLPEGVQGEFGHFLSLDDYNSNLVAIARVSGTLGAVTGKRFFLPGQFFESKSKQPFVEEKREIPVDVHYARVEQDQVTYRLPAGFGFESGPRTNNINWPAHAVFSIATTEAANKVGVVRKLVYGYTILGPTEYADLRSFYQKVAEADQQQLILTRSSGSSGN